MKFLLFICLSIPTLLWAQEQEKYLKGAVPEVNGKVTFIQITEAPMLSREQIFNTVQNWAEKRFTAQEELNSRVLYSNAEKGELACLGEEYLVFTDNALSLDRAKISYQMLFSIGNGTCEAKITSIRYLYEEAISTAETVITDRHALYKNKNKLIRQPGKFRTHTIDLVEKLFTSLQVTINPLAVVTPQTYTNPVNPETSTNGMSPTAVSSLNGFRPIATEKIPGNIIKLLSGDGILITSGNAEGANTLPANWGGLGYLYDKAVSFCFINPSHQIYPSMEKGATYTLTFYTETYRDALSYFSNHSGKNTDQVINSGLTPITTPNGTQAFAEAWLIIECRKLVSQSLSPESFSDEMLRKEWTDKPMQMFAGEILNVWVK